MVHGEAIPMEESLCLPVTSNSFILFPKSRSLSMRPYRMNFRNFSDYFPEDDIFTKYTPPKINKVATHFTHPKSPTPNATATTAALTGWK